MKITIATGIYPPEIGGHSFYAQSLKEALESDGHTVRLVLFGTLKRFPTGVRHLLYAIKLWWCSRDSEGIIAFDTFSVAIPAALVAMLTKKPTLNRAGGDFVWETHVNRTGNRTPLPDFYAHRERWNLKERLSFLLIRWSLSSVHVVFSSAWFRDIWMDAYKFNPTRTHVIENAIESKLSPISPTRKNFLFYTREIPLKNHDAFRRAFQRAKAKHPDIELEEGYVPHDQLLERIRSGYAVVLPSISEITPNFILESIRCGKPFLLTKYSGYAERFGTYGVIVDPLSEENMEQGIKELCDEKKYAELCLKISHFNEVHSYETIAREYVALFGKI